MLLNPAPIFPFKLFARKQIASLNSSGESGSLHGVRLRRESSLEALKSSATFLLSASKTVVLRLKIPLIRFSPHVAKLFLPHHPIWRQLIWEDQRANGKICTGCGSAYCLRAVTSTTSVWRVYALSAEMIVCCKCNIQKALKFDFYGPLDQSWSGYEMVNGQVIHRKGKWKKGAFYYFEKAIR